MLSFEIFVCARQIRVLHLQSEDGGVQIADFSLVFDNCFAKHFPAGSFVVNNLNVLNVLLLTFV